MFIVYPTHRKAVLVVIVDHDHVSDMRALRLSHGHLNCEGSVANCETFCSPGGCVQAVGLSSPAKGAFLSARPPQDQPVPQRGPGGPPHALAASQRCPPQHPTGAAVACLRPLPS
eukprot:scaffold65287_cov27-Prasinocladus_malaysianus.AAC.1